MNWLPPSVAALAVALLVWPFLIFLCARVVRRAAGRWPGVAGWSPLATMGLVGLAPFLLGLAAGIGAFWPGVLGHVLHLCHCGPESLHGGHTSVLHPELSATLLPYSIALVALFAAHPLRVVFRTSSALRVVRRRLASQNAGPVRVSGVTIRLVDMGQANAFATGFLRPAIYIDRTWWQSLAEEERGIVIAHERSHQRHRDPLVLLLGRVVCGFLPSQCGARLQSLLLLQMESRADRQASEASADALTVAEFLLKQHAGRAAPATALAFIATGVESRVKALIRLAEGPGAGALARGQWISLAGAAALVVSAFAFRGLFHRVAELLLATF